MRNLRIKQLIIVLCVFVIGIAACLLLERQMARQFIKKSEAITKGVAKNIEDIDNMMTQTLKNSLIGWAGMIDSGKGNTMEQAVELRDKFNVDNMDVFDVGGRMDFNTNGCHIPGGLYYEKFNRNVFSILQDDYCPAYRDMTRSPGVPIAVPLYKSERTTIPLKFAMLYSGISKKYLFMEYNCATIVNILANNINIYNNLIHLRLSGPVEEIASHGKHSNSYEVQTKFDKNVAYTDSIATYDSKLVMEFTVIFGTKYDNPTCIQKTLGRSNTSGEYFYVLTAAFSKEELNKQIFTIRTLCGTIILLVLGVMYLIRKSERDKHHAIQKVSHQVHHDVINSLWGLQLLSENMENGTSVTEEDISDIKDLVWSIEAIAANLSADHYSSIDYNARKPEVIYCIINKIVQICQRQHKGEADVIFTLKKEHYGLCCSVSQSEIERIFSNLLKNAFEAVPTGRRVMIDVSLEEVNGYAVINVTDNGNGMPQHLIDRIKSGNAATYNKTGGQGLGLSYTVRVIQACQGSVDITSKENAGTTITISIPCSDAPSWFLPSIELKPDTTLIIVDDSRPVHQVWQEKLKDHPKISNILSLYSPTDFEKFIQDNKQQKGNVLYIVDNHFKNFTKKGIAIIIEYNLQSKSILCTGTTLRDKNIEIECTRNNVRLLPKDFIKVIAVV
ncbi:hypothetical protein MIDIC_110116 [Alphaproteobacteria bacterium]